MVTLEYAEIKKRFLLREGKLVFTGESYSFDPSEFVEIPIKKGSLVLIHGSTVHSSSANSSSFPRNAYTFHVISGNSNYPSDNWLKII